MTARKSWRTDAASADFAGPARRIARWLAKQEALRFCAPKTAPPGIGRHLSIDERGYMSLLASDHLCRHNGTSPAGPCSAEPCQARGAACALLEIVHFEDDERADHMAAARDLFIGLQEFSGSIEKVEADLRTYLARAKQRHKGSWANARSHDHKKTCLIPANLLLLIARWQKTTVNVKETSLLPQFRSDTARTRLEEGLRPHLSTTVEAILRREGWKLREILATVGGILRSHDNYADEFENLKKRLAGVRKVEAAPVMIGAPSTAPEAAPSTASPTTHPSPMAVAPGDRFNKDAFSVAEQAYSAPSRDGLATGKVTGEMMASATGLSAPAADAVAPASDTAEASSSSDDPI